MTEPMSIQVILCETQPVTIEGFRSLCAERTGMAVVEAVRSPAECVEAARGCGQCVVVIDKAYGFQAITAAISELSGSPTSGVVVWGVGMTETEIVRYLQAGAKAALTKSAPLETILSCLRTVAAGIRWVEPAAPQSPRARAELTQREREVVELVGQGLRNREVALELGIRPGTVKVHLKHIFEKMGVPDRNALVLARLVDGRESALTC
jgi:DNA-binding NarL/FixJ family response regulator